MSFISFRQWAMTKKTQIIFVAILLLGIFARTWEFRTLPPGLHHDEASIGMEAHYLLHYGVDRNNVSYPVHLISWGNGQNAPLAYILIPLIATLGLHAYVIRMPLLLSGIATLPFIYLIFRRTVDEKFGLFAMFCITISPWHILLSRWGVESNLLPFFFTVGYFFLLKTRDDWWWFIPANILFAICLYIYGTTYAFMPIFILLIVVTLLRSNMLSIKQISIGLSVLFVLGLPIILFVAINILGFESIHIGPLTIPKMPTPPRFHQGAMFQVNPFKTFTNYSKGLVYLLFFQNDLRLRNILPPYGYFYGVTFPLALLGIWLLGRNMQQNREEKLLWFSWLSASIILGTLEPVIVNRINIIFIPWICFIAYFLYWLGSRYRYGMATVVSVLLIAFSSFTYAYHGKEYRREAGKEFYTGLLTALQYAQGQTDGPICITTKNIYMPYIFVLYTEKIPPSELATLIHYVEPISPLREVDRLGRYTFGLKNCADDPEIVYLLYFNERLEHPKWYDKKDFGYFMLYSPKKK